MEILHLRNLLRTTLVLAAFHFGSSAEGESKEASNIQTVTLAQMLGTPVHALEVHFVKGRDGQLVGSVVKRTIGGDKIKIYPEMVNGMKNRTLRYIVIQYPEKFGQNINSIDTLTSTRTVYLPIIGQNIEFVDGQSIHFFPYQAVIEYLRLKP
jgi:hypothetical protein